MTTMTDPNINRRAFERFVLNPGYTAAAVRRDPEDADFALEGHVYDLSEGGICFELDEPLEPGTAVEMRITLPSNCGDTGPGSEIFVTGDIIWCDLEEPGASRMALAITGFERAGDKKRMIRAFSARRYLRAA